jgi:hypothetical protein
MTEFFSARESMVHFPFCDAHDQKCREISLANCSHGHSSSDSMTSNGAAIKEDSPKASTDGLQEGDMAKDETKEAHGQMDDKEFYAAVGEYWKEGQQVAHRNILFEVWQVRASVFSMLALCAPDVVTYCAWSRR